jgi:prepilin-type N-terminal cleavage/methylation domain-containing protein
MMKKGLKNNNGGFSLVELLAAVAILATVIGVIFNAYITSARVARKSHDQGNENIAAQNVIETVKSMGIRDLTAFLNNAGNGPSPLFNNANVVQNTPMDPGLVNYNFNLNDFQLGGSTFNVNVDFNALPHGHINNDPVTNFLALNNIFVQFGGLADPDLIAVQDFAGQVLTLGATHNVQTWLFNQDFFSGPQGGVQRSIDIFFTRNGARQTVDVTARYTYTCTFIALTNAGAAIPITLTPLVVDGINVTNLTYNDVNEHLGAIYFCYSPYFFTADTIRIHNNVARVVCDFYLVRQRTRNNFVPAGSVYFAEVFQVEQAHNRRMNVFSNILLFTGDNFNSNNVAIRLSFQQTNISIRGEFLAGSARSEIITFTPINRMYTITTTVTETTGNRNAMIVTATHLE